MATAVTDEEWSELEEARLRLARLRLEDEEGLDRAFRRAVGISGDVLGVLRVGVWTLDTKESVVRCICLRDLERPACESQLPTLRVRDLGAYEEALVTRRAIAAEDVRRDPMTADIADEYFDPQGIASTLDVPFYRDGRVAGIVCHEHRGAPRTWSDRDIDFATTVAEVVASLMLSAELKRTLDSVRAREVALEQALRSEAVGRIARAVAHDIGNLLGVISLATEMVERRGDQPEARSQAAQTIHNAAESAMRLARQLLAVAGKPEASGGPRVLDDIVSRFATTLHGLASADRSLDLDLGQPGAIVPLDRTQIEQVLLNLVVNAREATPPGGRIRVSTRSAPTLPGAHWPMLALEVSDDGEGMDERTRSRIFDPYFSTKDGRKNSGLDLATVRGIVLAAGGEIVVTSAPGAGSTFSVRLPVMDAPVARLRTMA